VLRPRNELSLRAAIKDVDTHGSWSGELSLLAEGDKTRDVDSRWTMVADRQGEPKCILITCNDITEKKLLEAQYLRSQRLESLGTLASGVAHDLNNILSPIIMGVDMLEHAIHDQEHQAILGMMHESAQRGKETIRQLLTFARGAESEKGPVQPRHLLKEVARLVQQTFPKNIQIYTDYTGEPATVMGDPSQLHQVLMNLCINARDAMPEGGVVFLTLENKVLDESSANIHPKARPVPYIVFKVSDSGMGIPPHVLDRIFDPFFTTKPLGKGTGLGLATVLGIVESHGGFVLVESTLGKGTTFQVYLPAGAPAQNGTTAPQEPSPVRRGQGELVLIVDDELPIVRMAEEILRHSGYVTLTASNASEALHLFEKNHDLIRAVLTDIMMPFGDGRQLIMALYEKDPELPIIAMSGLATREFQRETIMRGARAFLSKPFTSDQLLALLADTLKHDTRSTQSTDGASPPPNNPHAN
jgi:signal transduction histidine kinase/ActR/RegA family two-component response regulator